MNINLPKKVVERVRAIIILEKRILLINRVKQDESYWVIPGGRVESKENHEDALKRECLEEMGVSIKVKNLFFHKSSEKPETFGHQEYYYLCDITGGEVGTGEGPEFQRNGSYVGEYNIQWVDFKNFINLNLKPKEVKEKIIKEFL